MSQTLIHVHLFMANSRRSLRHSVHKVRTSGLCQVRNLKNRMKSPQEKPFNRKTCTRKHPRKATVATKCCGIVAASPLQQPPWDRILKGSEGNRYSL